MALISFFDDPMDCFRPSRILDQHFGIGLDEEDLLSPVVPRRFRRMMLTSPYTRNWRSFASRRDKGSTVSVDKNKFQVSLDVQQFAPEEITVKTSGDNTITIEGKHEEKEDEHGYISRHFVRKYTLPNGHNIDQVQSKLSSDGVLTITAPKIENKSEEREIPIALTGQPSRPIENGSGESEEKMEKEKKSSKRSK